MSSIDIVIPCYRYGRYLRECVQSVLSQDVPNCRILIIDDESPDETPEVAQALVLEDPRVAYRRHTVNRGHIGTYNEGIEWCESDYMLLLSADDCLLPGSLARAMALLDAHPGMGLCFGNATVMLANGTIKPMSMPADFAGKDSLVMDGSAFIQLCADTLSSNIVPTPTAVVRTALLKQTGAYRADLPHTADMELWLRIAARASVGVVKEAQAMYRRHSANMSSAYHEDNRLSDLLQRQAAFDVFLAGSRDVLPAAAALHGSLMLGLSREAVGEASDAFSEGRLSLSDKLRSLALKFHPSVRQTRQWKALAFKRLIGVHASKALRPIAAKFRVAKPKGSPG